MQRMLGKAAAVAAGALIIAGMAAPAASAHVSTGGAGGGVVTADEPFVAGWMAGWASTDHVHTKGEASFWATDEATGGEGSHEIHIDGWDHDHEHGHDH